MVIEISMRKKGHINSMCQYSDLCYIDEGTLNWTVLIFLHMVKEKTK
jgi:hypothetical protein